MLSQRQERKSNTLVNLFVLTVSPHEKNVTSVYYAAKFHRCSDTPVTSHVLCVVMQLNPQVALGHTLSLEQGHACPNSRDSDSHWWSVGYFLSSLLKSFQSVVYRVHHQSKNQSMCLCFGNLTLRLLITHFLPNSKPCKVKMKDKDIVFSRVQGKVVLHGCIQLILLLLLFPTPSLSILFCLGILFGASSCHLLFSCFWPVQG